ncbi:hypothetical protein ACIPQA_33180 [Streptomyces sp. NPDC090109]|uniref:hypothetical protein n=1 Tax=unclassified Streptomyces TaxID=2593676 RepID=UPI0036754AE2
MDQLIKRMTQEPVWHKWVAANSTQAAKEGCISTTTKDGCISTTTKSGCIS